MKPNLYLIPIITILVATIGRMLGEAGIKNWYKNLKKPDFTPDNEVIGWAWSAIFVLTAVSALIIWNSGAFLSNDLMFLGILFLVNALMNIFWSFLFFQARMLGYAFIDAAG